MKNHIQLWYCSTIPCSFITVCNDVFWRSLKDIRLSENPIVDPSKGGLPRFVLIARLAKIKMLNGSEVASKTCVVMDSQTVFFYLHQKFIYCVQVSQRERKESEIRWVDLFIAYIDALSNSNFLLLAFLEATTMVAQLSKSLDTITFISQTIYYIRWHHQA